MRQSHRATPRLYCNLLFVPTNRPHPADRLQGRTAGKDLKIGLTPALVVCGCPPVGVVVAVVRTPRTRNKPDGMALSFQPRFQRGTTNPVNLLKDFRETKNANRR